MKLTSSHLAEICEINPRTSFQFARDQLCSFVPMEAVDDESAQITKFPLRRFDEVAKGYTIFAENDVIVAKITPCMENGKCAVVRNLRNGIGFGSTEFHVLRATTQVLPEWLFYFWRFPQTRKRAEKNMTGTAGQKRVPSSFLEQLDIPVPPLHEQKRIAALLEKTDRLRRTRRYARQLSDTFLQPVFLEMFGDLTKNQYGWEFDELENCAEVVSGVAKGQKYRNKKTVEVPYLRVANVQDGYLDLSEIKRIKVPPEDVEALRLQSGDVLMTEGGDFDKLGRGAIWRGPVTNCIHQNHIFRVRLDRHRVLPVFFGAFLLNPFTKAYFLKCSKQTTNLASINMTQLRALPVPCPLFPLQQKFADIVRRFERLRAQQREAERQAEHLFQTLLHRAFTSGL